MLEKWLWSCVTCQRSVATTSMGRRLSKAPYHLFFFTAVDPNERSRFFDIMKQEDGFSLAETCATALAWRLFSPLQPARARLRRCSRLCLFALDTARTSAWRK